LGSASLATQTQTPTLSPTAAPSIGLPCLAYAIQASTGDSTFVGNGLVDSYDSSLGNYGGSNVGGMGGVRAGGNIVLGAGAQINGTQVPQAPEALTPVPVPTGAVNLGDLSIHGNQPYILTAGDYVVDSLSISGNSTLQTTGGQVRIWFNNLSLAGTVGLASATPNNLWFFSRTSAQVVSLNGTCTLYGVIFAPNVPITDGGTGGVFGALIGSQVTLNGGAEVHYDQRLGCSSGGYARLMVAKPLSLSLKDGGNGDTRPPERINPYARFLSDSKPIFAVPNPARDSATVAYYLKESSKVVIRLFSMEGKEVRELSLGEQAAGIGTAQVDLRSLGTGIYFAVLTADAGNGPVAKGTFKLAVLH
jgi:hypothetical protein